jgi:predicted choloylglycine hydrolase
MMSTRSRAAAIACFALALTSFTVTGAVAAKGGGGKPSTSSLSLVVLDSTDGPHQGEHVTFDVSTTATDRPWVSVNCYDATGAWIYTDTKAFFLSSSRDFTLSNTSWTSGAADCKAKLYKTKDGTRTTTLATLDFHVYA